MEIIRVKNYEELSNATAKMFEVAIKNNPSIVLGLATGGTPEGAYKMLVENSKDNRIDWSEVKTFNLDEYVGIGNNHQLSYHTYMSERLFSKINIKRENTHVPDGSVEDAEAHCAEYDKMIEDAGGIELQLLGIGENGHIAFNEPGSSFIAGTSIVELTESTIKANSRYFTTANAVPKTAISMGIATIMKAKRIVLVASGANKAKAIFNTIHGPVTENVPASILQQHDDVTLIIDETAATKITDLD